MVQFFLHHTKCQWKGKEDKPHEVERLVYVYVTLSTLNFVSRDQEI